MNRKMRRLIGSFLAIVILCGLPLVLAGCGQSEDSAAAESAVSSDSEATSEDTAASDTATNAPSVEEKRKDW